MGPLRAVPEMGGGMSTLLSPVAVPRAAAMLTAGAAVLTAALGPGGTAKALLSAAVAGVEATSAGAGEVGSDSVLAAPSALGADTGIRRVSRMGPMPLASQAPATFCSFLLLEATERDLLGTHTFQTQGEAGLRALSGPWPELRCPVSPGELHPGTDSKRQIGWKSVNWAQPFSSVAKALGALVVHSPEPTPGAGTAESAGSSSTIHVAPPGPPSTWGPSFWAVAGGVPAWATVLSASEPSFPSWPSDARPSPEQLSEA